MDKIFGREEILSALKKRVDGFKKGYRQNVALIGAPSIGKSSILRRLLSDIDNSGILPIILDLQGRSLKQVIRVFSSQILHNFLKKQEVDIYGEFTYLIEKSQAFLPKTVAKIKSIEHNLEKDKKHTALLEAFDLPQIFSEESNIPCLLILDEFLALEDLGGEDIFAELGKKIVIQKSTMYLITSSASVRAKEILSHGFSLLFGNFELLEVRPYNIAASEEFINANFGLSINYIHRKFLIYFSGGQPFYLDVILKELHAQAAKHYSGSITEDILIETFENLLFEEWGIFHQKFINFLDGLSSDKQREDYVAILSSILSGCNKIKIIAGCLKKKEKVIQQRLLHLYDSGIIFKNEDFLCLRDKIFSFWLESVYNQKYGFNYFDDKTLRINFRNNLLSKVNSFSVVLEKTVTERIMELLDLFKDEAVQFERKKIILSHFKEIRLLAAETNNFSAVISAKGRDNFWIIAVKNAALSEQDVAEFIAECKKYKTHLSQRRIIIALDKVDTNAKLKALEEKVMTWETAEINSLFELYSQPTIFI